ncbi:MAG: squalene synthase HpnC [Azospirillaceae bacterium]
MIETPSGKQAADENFPVGSVLIAARLRPHVAAFYAFARAADDIADNPSLAPEDKVRRLDLFDAALTGDREAAEVAPKAARLAASCAETGVPVRHGRDLLSAFRQDATKTRYTDWAELRDYCARSASPVGRFLVDLHGEPRAAWPASDALCDALQVLNHLQDCAADHAAMDRVYLPLDWLEAHGTGVEALRADHASPGLRAVLDACLDETDRLIAEARALAPRLGDRRFAMEAATIVALAGRLAARLRREDPIAGRVALSKLDFLRCGVAGVVSGLLGPRRRPAAPPADRAEAAE